MGASPQSGALVSLESQKPLQERSAAIKKLFRKPAFNSSGGMLLDGQTKFLTHHFQEAFVQKVRELELVLITDVQFGHKCCRVEKLIEYRDWILAAPNRFCCFGGDMIDAWRIGSPGSGYDNPISPESQFYRFCEIMAPLRHRVLGFVGGNHERRGLAGGLDWGTLMASVLELPYSAGAQLINLYYGTHQPFPIYLWHGRGAARTAGAQVNMTLSAVPNDQALIYFSGHIHSAHAKIGWHARRNLKDSRVDYLRYYVVSASSFLEFWNSYAEVQGGTYSGLEMPVALLRTDGWYRVRL